MGLGSLALGCLLSDEARGDAAPTDPWLPSDRTIGRGPKTSSFCTWSARRRSSTCSITSRRCKNSTASLCPKELIEGQRFAFIRGHPSLLGHASSNSPSMASRASSSRSCCRTWPAWPTTSPSSKRCTPSRSTTARRSSCSHTGFGRFGRPSIGSWVTYGLGSENRDLPGLRRDDHRATSAGAGSACGAAAFCRASIKASSSAARATRSCSSPIPPASTRDDRRRMLDGVQATSTASNSPTSAIPRSPRASRSTRWPSACRPACRS